MTTYFYKLIVDKTCSCECDSYQDYCDCEPIIKFEEIDFNDDEFLSQMRMRGFVKEEEALEKYKKKADRNSKIELSKEFYYQDGAYSLTKLTLDKINSYYTKKLGQGAMLLQKVDLNSLKSAYPEAYKIYQQAKKKAEATAKKKKEAAKKRAATKKKKELEKAKALLKEAGEL